MIVIATPTKDQVGAGFAYDLVQMLKDSSAEFIVSKGTILPNQRTTLVKTAIKMGASHLLFIDSDMRFPPETVEKLLIHNKSIVACNYVERGTGKETVRYEESKVVAIGFGVMLINLDVFRTIAEPWFATPYDGEKFVGEDIFFCRKVKEAGIEIFIDNELSKKIGHEGLYEWRIK